MDVLKPLAILALAGMTAPDRQLFSSREPLELTLEAPLQELFEQGAEEDKFAAAGVLTYRDPATGSDVEVRGIKVSVRGHTSRHGNECPFPKLKLALGKDATTEGSIFEGLDGVRIGTHCGETEGEQLTPEFGRLANEKSPLREAFVYRLLDVMGVPAYQARPARITYVDTTGAEPRTTIRNAVLLENDDDAKRRFGATGEITMERFTNARDAFAPIDTARLSFAEAMIGNFDWCLRFYPEDAYRCNPKQPIWNIAALERPDRPALPVIGDFDLAGMVVGSHDWFGKVYFEGFLPSRSSIDIEVLSQVQRTRSLYPRAVLDDMRRYFSSRRTAAYAAVDEAHLDPRGRELATRHLDAFFAALADDAFYRPAVARPNAHVYVDAARTREACQPGDVAPLGTAVNVLGTEGEMAQVTVLDVQWQWAPPRECAAVRSGPVWIESSAIRADYPQ